MAYRTRSKYTSGGGVLAFFEQVSRFVSLSVVGWMTLSLFFILFAADGKITDSFDLHLFKGLFTQWELFWTVVVLLALNGLWGALVALPAAMVLFLSRQYLDFQATRASRRSAIFRIQFAKSLPVAILILSHVAALVLNFIAAPQLTRSWFREGNRFSTMLAGGHFVMTSLTRSSVITNQLPKKQLHLKEKNAAGKDALNRRVYIFMLPAEQIESEEFISEQSKIADAVRVPFVIPKSSVTEQVDSLLSKVRGPTAELARKTLSQPRNYSEVIAAKQSKTIVSMSPQLRFGSQLAGYGSESLGNFRDVFLLQEAQRRIVLSQVHFFAVFRILDGVGSLNQNLGWLNLIADDVARLRSISNLERSGFGSANSITIVQLSGLESTFAGVQPPFRPIGWSSQLTSYEKRMINKNMIREIVQFLQDLGAAENSLWVILPYADDKRLNPRSFALFSGQLSELHDQAKTNSSHLGFLGDEVAREMSRFLSEGKESAEIKSSQRTIATSISGKSGLLAPRARLECFETEVDFSDPGFSFQSSERRERSLGELLNSLPLLPDSDLAFLTRSASSLISRDLGLGFICRTAFQSIEETYLLKYKRSDSVGPILSLNRMGPSVLLARPASQFPDSSSNSKVRGGLEREKSDESLAALQSDVLDEFTVHQYVPVVGSEASGERAWGWRRMDEREVKGFFGKHEFDALEAIELSARARIH